MRRALASLTMIAAVCAYGSAFAVSDGVYSPEKMHCSGGADNVERPDYAEDGCHAGTVTISDLGGHEYFGIGLGQTVAEEEGVIPGILPFGLLSNIHRGDVWYDAGDGCVRNTYDAAAPAAPAPAACPWFDPSAPNYYGPSTAPNPASGLQIYFGFDDNTAGGEHDSSELMNNGPSDGGGIQVSLDPAQVGPWIEALAAQNPQFILTHPLPIGDAGIGFCADGICASVVTARQVAYQGGGEGERDVSNYDGKTWDPDSCSGNDDGSASGGECDDASTPGTTEDITYWHNQEGTTYVQPGVQIYEDPDPQASPLGGGYPIPALYIGTCGIVIGGGDFAMPASDLSNASGQWVIQTGC
jgi:hypothetical protein